MIYDRIKDQYLIAIKKIREVWEFTADCGVQSTRCSAEEMAS
jgi:hypothetical protein